MSLAMSGVTEPVSSVGVTVGVNVHPPALPQAAPPGPSVVVRGTAEHSEPVRNMLEVNLEETIECHGGYSKLLPRQSKLLDMLR